MQRSGPEMPAGELEQGAGHSSLTRNGFVTSVLSPPCATAWIDERLRQHSQVCRLRPPNGSIREETMLIDCEDIRFSAMLHGAVPRGNLCESALWRWPDAGPRQENASKQKKWSRRSDSIGAEKALV